MGSDRTATATVAKPAGAPSSPRQRAQVVRSLTRDFLAWIADGPRMYADVLATWPSSCPRLSIWEDALDDGLVAAERSDGAGGGVIVRLTARGRAVLDETSSPLA